ncbi:hypothetical protein B0E54_01832 [Micromonospora sp. MH99]|nr:hypothetical protein [Micromonospora sp. MH99]
MDSTVLHSMARRYLEARYLSLQAEYRTLSNSGRQPDDYHHTVDARRIFPRYQVVEAILVDVERLDPDRLPSLDDVAGALLAAAYGAHSDFTTSPTDDVAAQAIADERRLFAAQVPRWRGQPDLRGGPLPYRRVLTTGESSAWRTSLQKRWGVRDDCWHPLVSDEVPTDVLVLTGESMWEHDGVDQVRRALLNLRRRRVVEIREWGPDHILDLEIFAPRYTGAEGVWTDEQHDWVAYASHEGTVAFGGVLATGLCRSWADVGEWRWPGWPQRLTE